ncbi:MAG: hypothetical protein PHS14_18990 [Elusimicrobia bacterium]|nr:hypothetical protein [Elusimicrobiota bacterium]
MDETDTAVGSAGSAMLDWMTTCFCGVFGSLEWIETVGVWAP